MKLLCTAEQGISRGWNFFSLLVQTPEALGSISSDLWHHAKPHRSRNRTFIIILSDSWRFSQPAVRVLENWLKCKAARRSMCDFLLTHFCSHSRYALCRFGVNNSKVISVNLGPIKTVFNVMSRHRMGLTAVTSSLFFMSSPLLRLCLLPNEVIPCVHVFCASATTVIDWQSLLMSQRLSSCQQNDRACRPTLHWALARSLALLKTWRFLVRKFIVWF